MRHKKKKKILSLKRDQRRALLRGLLINLIERESIITTERRAKEVHKIVDRLMKRAIINSLSTIRYLESILQNKAITRKLIKNYGGSKVKIFKLPPRKGDGASQAKLLIIKK